MRRWWIFIFIGSLSATNAFRGRLSCSLEPPSEHRLKMREDLEMLGQFMGHHDQWDKSAANWARRHSKQRTILLPEKVRDVRIMTEGHLSVLGTTRRWIVDVDTDQVVDHRPLLARDCREHRLSPDGRHLYSLKYDLLASKHSVQRDGKSFVVTDTFPLFVTESIDTTTTSVGFCSESVLMASMSTEGGVQNMVHLDTSDVVLASAAVGNQVFHGTLNGRLVNWDKIAERAHVHVLQRNGSAIVPSVRSMDAEFWSGQNCRYVYAGCQDGTVRVCRYDDGPEKVTEVSCRQTHVHPVTQIRCHSSRVVSCDESGHVVVSDVNGSYEMYSFFFGLKADPVVDLSQTRLVVGHGHAVHLWDHDIPPALHSLPQRTLMRRRGQGGGGVGVNV